MRAPRRALDTLELADVAYAPAFLACGTMWHSEARGSNNHEDNQGA